MCIRDRSAPLGVFSLEGAWHHLHEGNVAGAISSRLPSGLRHGWWNIVRGRTRGGDEVIAAQTADWIEQHGRELGFRTPT
eukprot:9434903-Alexandrium_andersonii.AAC.1